MQTTATNFQANKELIISGNKNNILSKSQQTFNRLTRKVEKLEKALESTTKNMDECLAYYGASLHPLEQKLVNVRSEVVKQLYVFYTHKTMLTREQRKVLKSVILFQLDDVLAFDPAPDEEIKAIFKNLEGISYETAANQDFDEMKNEMEEMLAREGFDLDFNGINRNSSPEEMMKKIMEAKEQFEQLHDERETKNSQRKKTRKQLEKDEREREKEILRKQSISSIYKQLAKILHPDLEQDETIKIEKGEMMKQLTAAYEANDLHTLLRLEMQWIYKENNQLDELSENKLSIYNELLKEQIQNLEMEIGSLNHNMKYQALERFSNGVFGNTVINKLALMREEVRLKNLATEIEKSIQILKSNNPTPELLEIIKVFRIKNKLNITRLDEFMNLTGMNKKL